MNKTTNRHPGSSVAFRVFGCLCILLFAIFFSSCSSFNKSIVSNDGMMLAESSLGLLNGKYERKSTSPDESSSAKRDLFDVFFGNTYWGFDSDYAYKSSGKAEFLQLEVIDKNKISVSFVVGDETVKTKVMRGKIINGYFEFRRKYLIIPAIAINLYMDSKVRIRPSADGDLMVDFAGATRGSTYFIIPIHFDLKENNMVYKRVGEKVKDPIP